ncbi:MAG: baseplate J/gp47 family protein [Eubacteriales bacterium]
MSTSYESPEFLSGNSVDEIHQRMLDNLPSDLEKTENSIPWDFTRPVATEKAEFVEFHLNETIKLIFPLWAYGQWLDYHGEVRNVSRRDANPSSGYVTVTGTAGTEIPTGFQFATAANVATVSSSVVFFVVEGGTLQGEEDENGKVSCEFFVEAVTGGVAGNVAADTIKLMVTPISEVSYVTNQLGISGGTEIEDDESFRERIMDAIRGGISYTGCNGDYLRWAKEVSGVGYVIVNPEWADPEMPEKFHYTDHYGVMRCAGTVRLIIMDENGSPANEQILEEVYQHIMGADELDINRLAPVGAKLTVVAPDSCYLDISAQLVIEEDQEIVFARIRENLNDYWLEVALEAQSAESSSSYVYWVQVGAVIAKTKGVVEYNDLKLNGGTGNLLVTQAEFPTTGTLDLEVVRIV